ncbi:hypothetical protein SNE40_004238 [Patella caerulea]|uniref:N-acetylglucosaminylphosphatidylinositol deacetylase n=2 Tax=Patella caerulea TaxID=87958 RepID=A0AAN8KCV9_PATCE
MLNNVYLREVLSQIPHPFTIIYTVISVSCFLYILLKYFEFGGDILWQIRHKNILLIIAHPDDECMFFGPSVLNLLEENKISILCMTSGNFYDIGKVRKTELLASASVLGISTDDVVIIDKKEFPDNPSIQWDNDLVCKEILDACTKIVPDIIITFDDYGVSGHQNHISLFHAIRTIVKNRVWKNKLPTIPVVYSLDSISLWRKYISILDLLVTLLIHRKLYISSLKQALLTQKAMFAHRSQLMWFRRLYIIFSRYMFINTFTQIKPD